MAIQYENMTDDGLLFKFRTLIEDGHLVEVSREVYDDFVAQLMENKIPVSNDANIYHMGKRLGALYNELLIKQDSFNPYHDMMGNESYYDYKYPDSEADFGWIEDIGSGGTFYYLNPDCYPSWFHQNIVHFRKKQPNE